MRKYGAAPGKGSLTAIDKKADLIAQAPAQLPSPNAAKFPRIAPFADSDVPPAKVHITPLLSVRLQLVLGRITEPLALLGQAAGASPPGPSAWACTDVNTRNNT